jgi:predicted phage gp36 major capsid-like protein
MAAKLDLQCLYGGTPDTDDSGLHLDAVTEPTAGVLTEVTAHAAGNLLGATAVDGTAITVATPFNELLDLVYAPRVLNEESNVLVSNVKMRKRYDSLYTTTQEHAELPATVTNMQWLTTNAVPTFARGAKDHVSDIFGGDFSQVMVGVRLGVQLRFLTERYAENGQVGILAYFRGDIQIPRPAALAVYRFIRSYSA